MWETLKIPGWRRVIVCYIDFLSERFLNMTELNFLSEKEGVEGGNNLMMMNRFHISVDLMVEVRLSLSPLIDSFSIRCPFITVGLALSFGDRRLSRITLSAILPLTFCNTIADQRRLTGIAVYRWVIHFHGK